MWEKPDMASNGVMGYATCHTFSNIYIYNKYCMVNVYHNYVFFLLLDYLAYITTSCLADIVDNLKGDACSQKIVPITTSIT